MTDIAASGRRPPGRRFVMLTEVRPLGDLDRRDEQRVPERRRQTIWADSAEAADRIARALGSLGMVRAGRQRVKIIIPGRTRDGARLSGT